MAEPEVAQIDLRARVVGPDERVYILFPGQGHSHYNFFDQRNTVFLDFPGLELPEKFNNRTPEQWKNALLKADSYREWLSGGLVSDALEPVLAKRCSVSSQVRQSAGLPPAMPDPACDHL